MFGSAYLLERGERLIVERYFNNKIQLAESGMKCRQALRYLDVFDE